MKESSMASEMALSRESYLSTVFQMLSFMKSKNNGVALFDNRDPEIDQTYFLTGGSAATPCGP